MVKLQKRFAYKYKDKEHYKYTITIPSETVEQLAWKANTELMVSIVNKNIVLKPIESKEKQISKAVKDKQKMPSSKE